MRLRKAASTVTSFLSFTREEPSFNGSSMTGFSPCDALIATGLGARLLLPTSALYESQLQTYYSLSTRRRPWCFILPQTAEEVSRTLFALDHAGAGASDWHIAIKSGGHHNDATNNIASGVTIDLAHMNSSYYDAVSGLASLQPGARWRDVYADLLKEGVGVTGGRDGDVGVGGFLLGGGNSYHAGKNGFACDTVVNFEVALANGSIVNANSTNNADLWQALKGGSSNFGVVTRFDVETFPARNISYGQAVMSTQYSDKFTQAIFDFTNLDEHFADNALVPYYQYDPAEQNISMKAIKVNTAEDLNSTAFEAFDRIAAIEPGTMTSMSLAEAAGDGLALSVRGFAFTLVFKNDVSLIRHVTSLHEQYTNDLRTSIGPSNFTTLNFFQPIPTYFGTIGHRKGRNMLGLDRTKQNSILWVLAVGILGDDGQRALAYAKGAVLAAQVKSMSKEMGSELQLEYLNYADASQDALGSYGEMNVKHIRDVAAKYDPSAFFQRRVPGGFKISRVDGRLTD